MATRCRRSRGCGSARAAPHLARLCCKRVLTSVTEYYLATEQNSLAHLLCSQRAKRLVSTLMSNIAFSRDASFVADTGILSHRYCTLLSGGTTIHITGNCKFFVSLFCPILNRKTVFTLPEWLGVFGLQFNVSLFLPV